jgi:hypothetical protein
MRQAIGDFLLRRLQEAGIKHIFGVPGVIVGGHALADSDYGVPGPQSAANSQIPLPRPAATSS